MFDEIMRHSEAFAVPYGNINSRILSFFQIVGAGKTIGMGLLSYALNAASLKHYPAGGPRTRRVLIATKDKQLRSQIATELQEELLKWKLVTKAPRVLELTEPKRQIALGEMFQNDIVVCCPQFLWTQDNERSEYLDQVLNAFQLICFDEVHWAYNQILSLLNEARYRHNLLFGFTASPINSKGEPLDYMAKFSVYGYSEAAFFDQSMKSIYRTSGSLRKEGYSFDDMIDVVRADKFRDVYGNESQIEVYERNGNSSIVLIDSIISAVLQRMYELDKLSEQEEFSHSPHRKDLGRPNIEVTEDKSRFWSHAIIRVDGIEACEQVCNSINEFIASRKHLQAKEGYRAVYATSEKGLDQDSPFFYAVKNDGRVSSKSARILVVDDMAKEGMNNKYVNINAWCKSINSIASACQSLGRAIRSTAEANGDSTKCTVPRKEHDRIHIIIHEQHEEISVPTIRSALHFMANMESQTSEIMTAEEYFKSISGPLELVRDTADAYLTPHEKRLIAILYQKQLLKKGKKEMPELVIEAFGARSESKINAVARFVARLTHYDATSTGQKTQLKSELKLSECVSPMSLVDYEVRDKSVDSGELEEKCLLIFSVGREVVRQQLATEVGTAFAMAAYEKVSELFESDEGLVRQQGLMDVIERSATEVAADAQKYEPRQKGMVEFKSVLQHAIACAIDKVAESVNEVVSVEDIQDDGRFNKRTFAWQMSHERDADNFKSSILTRMYEQGCFPLLSRLIGDQS